MNADTLYAPDAAQKTRREKNRRLRLSLRTTGFHPQEERPYTYSDFLTWPDDYRAEIIDGKVCEMPPPYLDHVSTCANLLYFIMHFLRSHPEWEMARAYTAPMSVRLFPQPDESDTTVVEPDIVLVLNPDKLRDGRGCVGAPDFVAEVLSPSNARLDRTLKLEKYRQAGVSEVWLIDPKTHEVISHLLQADGSWAVSACTSGAVPLAALPGLSVSLDDLFAL